ncbi:hypothetical protein ACFE04_003194 [Oxalis oulophora]
MDFLSKPTTTTTTTTTNNGGVEEEVNNNNNNNNKGNTSFLLVLFPPLVNNNKNKNTKNHLLSSPSYNRTNSSNLNIITKTQSTISICALLVFFTLLLFTLSTFEPNQALHRQPSKQPTLTLNKSTRSINYWYLFAKLDQNLVHDDQHYPSTAALQGMGRLYRRGTRAMSELVVCHVADDVNELELRLFLRVLHRSGLTARTDLVFIFESLSFSFVIETENELFIKLVDFYYKQQQNETIRRRYEKSLLGFDFDKFMKLGKREISEPVWGKRIKSNDNSNSTDSVSNETAESRLSYGSVVGFEASELDSEDSLAGFLDHVPMSIRRWACYPILLGRVRRNFKHVMLVDVKNSVLLGDPLGRVRNRSPESVYVWMKQEENKHHKRNSDKSQSHLVANSAILMGGSRGIRRFSSAMLYEIIRASTMHKKKKNSVTESSTLSQLVGNEHLLKNVNLMKSSESIPETSSLAELAGLLDQSIIQRGNSNYDVSSIIMKQICSCEIDSSVYTDCQLISENHNI